MGVKSYKFYVYFMCNPIEPSISGIRPFRTRFELLGAEHVLDE